MTVLSEENYLNDVLKWEVENSQSRETVTIAEGEALDLGSVVGMVTADNEVVGFDPDGSDGSEDAYGVLIADYSNATKTDWTVSTAYALHDIVVPTTPNGHMYKCVDAGSSHATTEPTWPTDGSEVIDATCTWVDQGLIPAAEGVAIVRDAQVIEANLVWPNTVTSGEQAAAMAQLKAKSIVTREEV